MYHLSQVTDVPKPEVMESGSKDHPHADVVPAERGIQNRRAADVPCKPKGERDITQDCRARFVVYRLFFSTYIVYVLPCILQWLPLNGHEESVSQHHSIGILSVLGICKQPNCSCLIHNECVVA